jgi:hypothetical protein
MKLILIAHTHLSLAAFKRLNPKIHLNLLDAMFL